jgi:hypothetical protein
MATGLVCSSAAPLEFVAGDSSPPTWVAMTAPRMPRTATTATVITTIIPVFFCGLGFPRG